MELTKYQQLYIQTVYDYFCENGVFPTYRQVEIKLLPKHRDFDVTEVAKSLVDSRYRGGFFVSDLNTSTSLTLEQIRLRQNSEQHLADFVKVVRYTANKYINSKEDTVEVTSNEISDNLHLNDLSIRIVGYLIQQAALFASMGNTADYSEWKFKASRDVIHYDGVTSIDDFLERREAFYKSRMGGSYKRTTLIDPAPLIEKVARTNPSDIQTTTANLMQVDNSYYINALEQSKSSFDWAIRIGVTGIAFFFIAAGILIWKQADQSYAGPLITALSGAVVEVIAGIILALHRHASDQVNSCHVRLNRMQRFLVANSACESLEGEIKQKTRAELIMKLADFQATD